MDSQYQKTVLPNGLKIITVPMPQVKSVTAAIFVGAGGRYENEKINGLSHFLEHMVFKGTKKRPTAFDISSTIDGIGGEFNAGTAKEYTVFYVKAAAHHLSLALDVLSDMILNSKLAPEDIECEKGVIMEEINMYEDTPRDRVDEFYEELLWPKNPLGWHVLGRKEVIRKIKRDDFLQYMASLYASNNMIVGMAGNFEKNSAEEQVGRYLGSLPARRVQSWEKVKEDQKKPNLFLKWKQTDQAHLVLGVRAYPLTHKERYNIEVLNTVLGAGMSSRLFLNIRERRGLAYYIHSSCWEYQDTGTLVAKAGVRLDKIEEAIKVTLGEFNRLRDQKVAEGELRKAKEYIKGRLTLGLEDSRAVAGLYCQQELLEGKIETPASIMDKIESVESEDIQRVARDIFVSEKLNLAVIGPFKKEEEFEKVLKI